MDSRDCLGLLRRWVGRLTLSWWDVALKSRAGGAGSTIRPSARSPAPNRRRSAKDRASDHLLPIETDDTFGQRVDAVGGFATTHVARLQREDGEQFSRDSEGCAGRPFWFCSFVNGSQCGPLLPVGFEERGRAVWSSWAATTTAPGTAPRVGRTRIVLRR